MIELRLPMDASPAPAIAHHEKRPLLLYACSKRSRFSGQWFFFFPPGGEDPRRVQRCPDQEDQQQQAGDIARAGAEDLLDQAEGGVAVGAAQEHEIGIAQMVDQGGGQQVEAENAVHFGQAADVGAEASRQK